MNSTRPPIPIVRQIDPAARPCQCYGARTGAVWKAKGVAVVIGYRCERCQHEWPLAAFMEPRP